MARREKFAGDGRFCCWGWGGTKEKAAGGEAAGGGFGEGPDVGVTADFLFFAAATPSLFFFFAAWRQSVRSLYVSSFRFPFSFVSFTFFFAKRSRLRSIKPIITTLERYVTPLISSPLFTSAFRTSRSSLSPIFFKGTGALVGAIVESGGGAHTRGT